MERHIRVGHVVLRRVHELWPRRGHRAKGEVAGVQSDNGGGGGEQVHGGAVYLRVVVAALHRGGVLGRIIDLKIV